MLKAVHLALVTIAAIFAFGALLSTMSAVAAHVTTARASSSEHATQATHAARAHHAARVANVVHVGAHDPTSLDDDDDTDDDADELTVVAPPHGDDDERDDSGDPDADGGDVVAALSAIADLSRFPAPDGSGRLSMTRRGIGAAGEHRPSAERPPRV